MTTDLALQSAKLEFIRNSGKAESTPFFWAAAILVGKTDTILMEKAFPWKNLIIVVVVAGLFFFQFFYWKKRREKNPFVQ